ncbi:MAG: glycosyltransferase family 2 protein [Planctomycetales bacterium]|nr:glycosyltransferase family 2 protein [Planctomycetales bacterium]
MDHKPTVSIIVPVYNAAGYISDAVNAALSQTYDALEVIVVDDGSTDTTASVIHAMSDSRLRYVFQKNQGQSAAINHGVSLSHGKLIKLLDADDWINSEHIASQVTALNGRIDAVASCRWGYFVSDFRNPSVRTEHTNASYDDPLQWIVDSLTRDEGMMGGWMWLIPRQIWDKVGGYDPRLSLNNDFHFSIATVLAANAVCYAKDAVYSYRKGVSGALSSSYGRKAMESAFLTTDLGTRALLQREDSPRIRRIAADRFQAWLFQFYPQFPDLVKAAAARIQELGGSSVQMNGGRLLKLLQPLIGWKGVRRLQAVAYGCGWQHVLRWKAGQRKARFE